jgi:hypothetical protein
LIHPIIISRLLEAEIAVWVPLDETNEIYIQRSPDLLVCCVAIKATNDGDNNPLIKVNGTEKTVAAFDPRTRNVWLLPDGHCINKTNIRLGGSHEKYLLPEPKSLSYLEQKAKRSNRLKNLKAQASDMIEEKLKENQKWKQKPTNAKK